MENLSLILEGGGGKGAYHCGVLNALHEEGILFNAVAGASIGAINGALYCQGQIDTVNNFWINFNFEQNSPVSSEVIEAIQDKKIIREVIKTRGKALVQAIKEFRGKVSCGIDLIMNEIDESAVRNSDVDFGLTVFNLSKRKGFAYMKKDIPEGKIRNYVIASANYPMFPAYKIDGQKYYDGGIYDNMPINLLSDNGYKKMIVIRTNLLDKRPRKKVRDVTNKLFYIAPEEKLGIAMNFTKSAINRYMEIGYNQAKEIIKQGDIMRFIGD